MSVSIAPLNALDELMLWRAEVIEAVFGQALSETLLEANRRYYRDCLGAGEHIAAEATLDGQPAGCGAICLQRELPSPDNPSGRCAYLMNIYVRPPFRGRGVATAMVHWLVDKALSLGCDKIYLETTPAARNIYKEIGFESLPGLMKYENN